MNQYPFLLTIVRHGKPGSAAIALVAAALGLWFGAAVVGWPFGATLCICLGLGAYGFLRSFVELTRIITEMLLPQ